MKSSTPTKFGDLNTIFEFELFGTGVDAGQTTFRLRHAYGERGRIWLTDLEPPSWTSVSSHVLEYWGPKLVLVLFRNLQLRWMPLRSEKRSITIALERPGASGDQGTYADRIELANIRPRFNFPDLSGNARIVGNWGYFQAAGIVRKIGWVDTSGNPVNLGGSVVGWGVNLTSNLNLSKNDVAKLAFVYGAGIENYMNDAPVDVGIANNPSNSRLPIKGVALPVLGVVSFLDHTWNKHFTTSVGYSLITTRTQARNCRRIITRVIMRSGTQALPPDPVTMGGEFSLAEA